LRAQFEKGTEQEFEELVMKAGDQTREEAEKLFNRWVHDGRLAMDPEGWWRWIE